MSEEGAGSMHLSEQPIGIVVKSAFLSSKTIMSGRAYKRKKDMPPAQVIATGIIKKICEKEGIRRVEPEKIVFCESIKRFYMLDIYISSLQLAIELDGNQHENQLQYDQKRDDCLLNDWGIVTLRFKNKEVLKPGFYKVIKSVLVEQRSKGTKPFKRNLTRCLFDKNSFYGLENIETWQKLYKEFNNLSKNERRKLLRYNEIPVRLRVYFPNATPPLQRGGA